MRQSIPGYVAGGLVAVLMAVAVPSTDAAAQNTGNAALPQSGVWRKLPGTAMDISINGAGQAYAIGIDGTPWHWDRE